MATRILLVSLFLSLLVACDKKEDDINPGQDYTGTLTLNYSRTFPTFQTGIDIELAISENGEVTFSEPKQVNYLGESQKMMDGERIKIREQGIVNVSSLSGGCTTIDNKEYLMVNLSCLLDGTQTVWKYTDFQWIKMSDMPYLLENPVESPMLFRIENAVMSEAICGGNCTDCWGNSCFRWHLVLNPSD